MALIDDLKAYWKMDEASGNIIDAHGSHDGTNNGADYGSTGIINDALNFVAANNDYIAVTDHADLRCVGNAFSVSLWIKRDLTDDKEFITKEGDWLMETRAGDFFQATLWGRATGNSDVTYTTGVWYHLVMTWDGTDTIKLFMNGHLAAKGVGAESASGTAQLDIGRRISDYHDGLMDEIGIWQKTLTDGGGLSVGDTAGGEVAELYNSGAGLAYPLTAAPTGNSQMMGANF